MKTQFTELSDKTGQILSLVQDADPELADIIRETVEVSEKPIWTYMEGDKCPTCKQGTMLVSHYGRGPFGPCNEILKCDNCEKEMQTGFSFD